MEEWKKNKGMGKKGRFKLERHGKAQACLIIKKVGAKGR
jgi:hypothetical protein